MGLFMSRFVDMFTKGKEQKILLLGLDGAGKTTILYYLKLGEAVCTLPTLGFNVENVEFGNLNMLIWDVGGQEKIRKLWRHYYEGTAAVIYIVDASDRDRIDIAREELQHLLSDEALAQTDLLIFANKQDLPQAMSVSEVNDCMQCNKYHNRRVFIQGCCATTGDGLYEGLSWLSNTIKASKKH